MSSEKFKSTFGFISGSVDKLIEEAIIRRVVIDEAVVPFSSAVDDSSRIRQKYSDGQPATTKNQGLEDLKTIETLQMQITYIRKRFDDFITLANSFYPRLFSPVIEDWVDIAKQRVTERVE